VQVSRRYQFSRAGVAGARVRLKSGRMPFDSVARRRGGRPMVGPQPSKLMMPVRSRSSAPMASSSAAERLPVKEMVVGSIPTLPASFMGVSFSS
jgi:hypothetical protein